MAEQEALSPKRVLEDIRSGVSNNSLNASTEREFLRSILVLENVADKPRVRICLDALGNSWFGREVMVSLVILDADLSVLPDDPEARDELFDGVRAASILGLEKIEEYKPFLDGFRKRHPVEPASAAEPGEGVKKSGVELLADPDIRQKAEAILVELQRVENRFLEANKYYASLQHSGENNEEIDDPNNRSLQELQERLSLLLNLEGDESFRNARNLVREKSQSDRYRPRLDAPSLLKLSYTRDNPDEQIRLLEAIYSKAPEKLHSLLKEIVEELRNRRGIELKNQLGFFFAEQQIAGIDEERTSHLVYTWHGLDTEFQGLVTEKQTVSLEDFVQTFIDRNRATAALYHQRLANDQLVREFQQKLAKEANVKITHNEKGEVILEEIPTVEPAEAQPTDKFTKPGQGDSATDVTPAEPAPQAQENQDRAQIREESASAELAAQQIYDEEVKLRHALWEREQAGKGEGDFPGYEQRLQEASKNIARILGGLDLVEAANHLAVLHTDAQTEVYPALFELYPETGKLIRDIKIAADRAWIEFYDATRGRPVKEVTPEQKEELYKAAQAEVAESE